MYRPALFIVLIVLLCLPQRALQHPGNDGRDFPEQSSDTIVHRQLEQIDVYPRVPFNMNAKRYAQMIRRIKKVYPVAKDAAREMETYNQKYRHIKSDRERRKYIKKAEKELFSKYETQLKRFSATDGRYLMLLIDRETNETSYDIIKELKGSFSAFFWQGIAKIFNNDLKEEYDPTYKHFVIEQIVLMIERGEL
jgi:hypothetical protein